MFEAKPHKATKLTKNMPQAWWPARQPPGGFNTIQHERGGFNRRDVSDLFGNGFAVQFVVHFSDLGHSESRDRECTEAEGHLLLWYQPHWGGRGYLCLRIFAWEKKKS